MTDSPTRERPRGKLTATAGHAANSLLNHLGITTRLGTLHGREPYPAPHVREQAALLADLASNGLMAGVDGDDVRRLWPRAAAALEIGWLLAGDVALVAELFDLEAEALDGEDRPGAEADRHAEAGRLGDLAARLRDLDRLLGAQVVDPARERRPELEGGI
jgi:hypothetical protein